MSRVFAAPPDGLNYDTFSGSVPNGMLYRIKAIEGLSKQVIKMVPTSGSTSAQNGNKIIVSLPMNSLLDLATFEWYFYAKTNHLGATAGGPAGYYRVRYFPRNMQSLIEQLEIKINGKSIQNIPQYNYIYNLLHDWVCGWDANTKRRIGEGGDPSNKSYLLKGRVYPKRGFPIGTTDVSGNIIEQSVRDADNYCVRNWLGLLSSGASTNIIHTDMYGQIDIEITLANGGILMHGVDPSNNITGLSALTATAPANNVPAYAISGFTDSVNLVNQGAITALGTTVAAESAGYTLSNIGFSIVRYDMPAPFYEAMRNVLTSGAVYRLYYPNYSIFQGIGTTNKSGTTRFSITTKSLDYVIGTFQVPNRDTITFPLNSIVSTRVNLEYGNSSATVANQIASGQPLTFNSSKYFVRNGSGIISSTWSVGNVRLPPQTPLEDYNSILKGFGFKNDIAGGCYMGCKNVADFIQCFYGSVLSLQAVGENDLFTVSGLDSSQQPVSIAWEVTGGEDVSNAADANQNVNVFAKDDLCTPVLIAAYSSHLDVTVGRNIVLYT